MEGHSETVSIGAHVLHPNRQLMLGEERVELGARALSILSVLAENRGEVLTKDELMSAVWPDVIVEENSLQVHVAALRKAMGDDGRLIETVRSIGYLLHAEPVAPAEMTNQSRDRAPLQATDIHEDAGDEVGSRSRKLALLALGVVILAFAAWLGISRALSPTGEEELTIIPFAAVGGDGRDAALATGITNELIVRLRQIEGLRVSTSVNEEGASERILKGSLQSDGDTMQLAVRLEDSSGTILWSDIFNRDLDALFEIQEEIARAVTGALSVSLDIGSESRNFGGTDNPEAYANYVQGRINRQNPDRSIPTAFLERAIELDPDYVKALVELTYVDGISIYFVSEEEEKNRLIRRMDKNSSLAKEIGSDIWYGHAARAWFNLLQRDFVEADLGHAIVEELDPGNDPELLNTLANFHSQLGRATKSAQLRKAKSVIDPIFPSEGTTSDQLNLRNFGKVIEMFESENSGFSEDGTQYQPIILYWALFLSGRKEDARNLAAQTVGDDPEWIHFATLGHTDAFPDAPFAELSRWADERYGSGGRLALSMRAHHASQLGKHRLALDYLRLAYNERDGIGGHYQIWHPALAPTRKTQGFADWIVELGMDDAWRKSGDWSDFCRPISDTAITCE